MFAAAEQKRLLIDLCLRLADALQRAVGRRRPLKYTATFHVGEGLAPPVTQDLTLSAANQMRLLSDLPL